MMSRELDSHIRVNEHAGKTEGAEILRAQRTLFNRAKELGLVIELPVEKSAKIDLQGQTVTLSNNQIMERVRTISVGEVIRRWREFRNLTVTELATIASATEPHVTKGYVSGLENNKIKNPNLIRLNQLASALNISPLHIYIRALPSDLPETSAPNNNSSISLT